MNGAIFRNWIQNQLLPALPPNSVVVMDNASYHSVQVEGTKAPISTTLKPEMKEWLRKRGIEVDDKLKKKDLYEIIQREKANVAKVYEVDTVLSENGHQVVRLPPYHCDLNPIELIWADVKRYVATNNETFKVKDVQELIQEAFSTIDGSKWKNACKHVVSLEKMYRKKDNIQTVEVQPIIIRLGDDSESDEAMNSDSESDGDETEAYDY